MTSPPANSEIERLIMAALADPTPGPLLGAAAALATSTRDRQLVALAVARAAGELDLLDSLARDHLLDYPGSHLAAWIASTPPAPHHRKDQP